MTKWSKKDQRQYEHIKASALVGGDSEVKLLEAERDFFTSLAAMQAALGLDPLQQAMGLTAQ